MNIVVAMPTYNEKDNVGLMIERLCGDEFPKINRHKMSLLIIDDYSPDGTGQIVREKMKKYKNLYLSEGPKLGLGAGYRRGFDYAINVLKADAVMEMDVDFQHDPADIKRFVAEFDNGYDYILGSRFIHGGTIPSDWGFKRKFLSVVGNLVFRVAFLNFGIHDFTTGFRLARVKNFLDRINFEKVFLKSYAYKELLLCKMVDLGAKVKEIPIEFANREKGWSKMDSEDFFESLKVILIVWKERLLS